MRRFNPPAGARRLGSGLALAAAMAAGLASTAQAGTMTNHTCRTPDGRPAGTTGWSGFREEPAWEVRDTCAAGGQLSILPQSAGHSSDEELVRLRYRPAVNTTLQSVTMRRAARLPSTGSGWGWSYSIGAGSSTFEAAAAGSESVAVGSLVWNGEGNHLGFAGTTTMEAQNELVLGMRCAGVPGQTCADPAGNAFLRLYGASFVTKDASDPAVTNVGGSLLLAGVKDGTETVTYNATDTGSGLYRAIVEVDGGVVQRIALDSDDHLCADAVPATSDPYEFTLPQPCKLAHNSGAFSIDTRLMAEGERSVRVAIEDATGNRADVFGPTPISIDNIPAPTSTSLPVVSGTLVRGSQLSTDAGGWDAHGVPITLAYQWQRSADNGASWAAIPGATTPVYTLGSGDVGKQIRTRVTGSSSEGTTPAYSASAGTVTEPAAPATPPAAGIGRPGADGQNGNDGAGGTGAPGATIVQTGNGRDASPAAVLAAIFDGTRSRTIKVRYGKLRRITGTLRLPNGQPIVGARLDVTAQPKLMGALPVAAGHVVTDSQGRFAYPLKATTSRTITIGYRWYTEAAGYTHTTSVTVGVIPAVSMKASRTTVHNGQSVKFAGRIKAAPRGARKVVEIQALDGRRWRTIATVRVKARKAGRFTYRYRFTRTVRPTVYRFRANVRAEQGWPFLTGHSRSRPVKVLP